MPTPAPPTATPPPTRTPLPTIVPVAMAIVNSGGESDAGGQPADGGLGAAAPVLLLVAGGAFLVGLLVAGLALWLWMRNRRTDLSRTASK
jgi:hypothetical protein